MAASLVIAVAALAALAAGADLALPGDVLIGDVGRGIVRIEPASLRRSVVLDDLPYWSLAFDAAGDLIAASNRGVVRVDFATGAVTQIRGGGFDGNVQTIAVAPDGAILLGTSGNHVDLWSIDPTTGVSTMIRSRVDCVLSCVNADLEGVGIAADGSAIVALRGYFAGNPGALLSVDRTTGAATIVAEGGLLDSPGQVVVDRDGSWLVADYDAKAILRVDPASGAQSVAWQGGEHDNFHELALAGDGHIVTVGLQAVGGGLRDAVVDLDPVRKVRRVLMTPANAASLLIVPGVPARPACSNGIDDDGDRKRDYRRDRGCSSPFDGTEEPTCADGIDNDADGLVDHPADPGCSGSGVMSEESPQCDDRIDNDGDGYFDFPDDLECASASDGTEHMSPRKVLRRLFGW